MSKIKSESKIERDGVSRPFDGERKPRQTVVAFDHERLHVYRKSLEVVAGVRRILHRVDSRLAVHNQLDRASTSIPLNIAEGNGKSTPKDRCRYLDIARGSAFECAAALDVLVAIEALSTEDVASLKSQLRECVAMLVGLIRANHPDRIHESSHSYVIASDLPPMIATSSGADFNDQCSVRGAFHADRLASRTCRPVQVKSDSAPHSSSTLSPTLPLHLTHRAAI